MYLNCHTYYSLKYGTLSPTQLVEEAAARGIKSLVLTDINNTSCSHAFFSACKKHGIKPVLGIEFREDPGRDILPNGNPGVHKDFYYTGIAKNREGWHELNSLITESSMERRVLPKEAPPLENCYIIYKKIPKGIHHLRENEYIGIRPTEVNNLYSSYLKNHQEKLVIMAPVTFLDDDGYRVHKLLRCIDLNIIIGNLKPEHCANSSERFYSEEELLHIFSQYPRIIENM